MKFFNVSTEAMCILPSRLETGRIMSDNLKITFTILEPPQLYSKKAPEPILLAISQAGDIPDLQVDTIHLEAGFSHNIVVVTYHVVLSSAW